MKVRTYQELRQYETFRERYRYLRIPGSVGDSTFGFDRVFNQRFYHSAEWKEVRNFVITRDNGCDLGVPGYEVYSDLLIHHMNPISLDDIKHGNEWILEPNYLITTSKQTHNAIHYGDESLLPKISFVKRRYGDTKLW
jgi:hypothetical protein